MTYTLSAKEMTTAILRYVVEEHCKEKFGTYSADVELNYDERKKEFTATVRDLTRNEE